MTAPLRFYQPPLITQRIGLLISQLQDQLALATPDAQDIHDLRVNCKKLRSWIRLLRHTGAADDWQHADHALRTIAKKFARLRDAEVLQQTVRTLQAATRSKLGRAACQQVLTGLQTLTPVAPANKNIKLARKVVLQLTAANPAEPVLRKGMKLTCQRCQRLGRKAAGRHASIEQLHQLRRWVKYLGYQLELVTVPAQPRNKSRKQLVALGRTLGLIHDLALLQQRLASLKDVDESALVFVGAQASRLSQSLVRQAALASTALADI